MMISIIETKRLWIEKLKTLNYAWWHLIVLLQPGGDYTYILDTLGPFIGFIRFLINHNVTRLTFKRSKINLSSKSNSPWFRKVRFNSLMISHMYACHHNQHLIITMITILVINDHDHHHDDQVVGGVHHREAVHSDHCFTHLCQVLRQAALPWVRPSWWEVGIVIVLIVLFVIIVNTSSPSS